MREVFADAAYWITVLNPRDGLHAKARAVSKSLNKIRILTSEMVLTEVLNSLGDKGPQLREVAVRAVDSLRSIPTFLLFPRPVSNSGLRSRGIGKGRTRNGD